LQPCLWGGPYKGLKTSTLLDAMLSFVSGEPFLGRWAVSEPGPAVFFSGENGALVLAETARRIAAAKGITKDLGSLPLHLNASLPNLRRPRALTTYLKARGARLCGLDPLYLLLPGVNGADLYSVGPRLKEITDAVLEADCTPVLVHHSREHVKAGAIPDLAD